VPPFDGHRLARAGRQLVPIKGKAAKAVLTQLRAHALPGPGSGSELEGASWAIADSEPGDGSSIEATTFAMFAADGWTILLGDELDRGVHSATKIGLVPPEGGPPCMVAMTDVYSMALVSVDGDPFAFSRFISWLRGGIVHGRHDLTIHYNPSEDDDDDEDEDENEADEEEDDDEAEPQEVLLSRWLELHWQAPEERFVVDWRVQFAYVAGGAKIADMASVYGFPAAFLDRLATRDAVQWRRFLREVVDPRFG
jgi:hypothetical protein